jgi:2-oxoglutarate dehydrogenase E1 component
MNPWDQFTGVNAGYVYELYERYQRDPGSVDEATRAMFAHWSSEIEGGQAAAVAGAPADLNAAIAAFNLAESIRRFGHLAAHLDPLGVTEPVNGGFATPYSLLGDDRLFFQIQFARGKICLLSSTDS